MDDLEDVKTIEECTDMAIADAHDEDEQVSGWVACLDDVFSGVKEIKLFGEKVNFKGFSEAGLHAVVAVCNKNNQKIRVTLDSLELIEPTDTQELWISAYLDWAGE